MGNTTSRRRVVGCFVPSSSSKDGPVNLDFLGPLDEGLGHSFCYVRPIIADYSSPAITPSNSERFTVDSTTFDSETHSGSFRHDAVDDLLRPAKAFPETTFKTISGASVSANVSTARTGNTSILLSSDAQEPAASFESTASFAAIPLQPVPRGSGPLNGNGFMSGPLERGFASGPLERGGAGFMSGPLEKGVFMSGPLDGTTDRSNFSAPLAFGRRRVGFGRLVRNMSRPMKSVLTRTFTRRVPGPGWMHRYLLHPMTKFVWNPKEAKFRPEAPHNCMEVGPSEPEYSNTRNLQWAHGKAGEDRVHVVLSEEQGWLFVGIYDGFSGPDAPDFLMSSLYKAIDKELEGLLWDYEEQARKAPFSSDAIGSSSDCVKGGSVASPCYNPDWEKQCVPSHSGDDCFENQCHAGVLPLQSKEDECQEKSILDNRSIEEAVEAVEIAAEKNGTKEMDCLPMATIEILQEPEENLPNRDTEAGHIGMPPDGATPVLPNRCKKSKRLYELLQMEPVEHYDPNNSQLALEYGSRETSSLDLLSNAGEDLCTREGLPVALQFSFSASIKGEGSSSMGETESFRENEGALGEDSEDFKQRSVPSFSVLGHKQTIKRSLIGSRLRKMYRKQKSLRKKLFPWNYDWHRDQPHMVERMVNQSAVIRRCKSGLVDHDAVLKAISRALQTTEEAYMEMVEESLDRNPELALMGSCVLVMLMKDQDVYVMNLGDSRVILAQDRLNDRHNNLDFARDDSSHRNRSRESLVRVELDRISEESPMHNLNSRVCKVNKTREISICRQKMRAAQLSTDHSTGIEEEVLRIKAEHPDDAQAILNDRVKGQLKVTRAFGAGFLKKPKFNEALLEMFQVDYVGTSPYVSCIPSVLHHRLCPDDRFLVLSSDGLYQYFSNEEVVSHVAWFMENVPEGDPAQYLIAELLLRAAKKNGMDFHELLDIPHGDRRKYHDDVSVMVISLEGRIWRSSG